MSFRKEHIDDVREEDILEAREEEEFNSLNNAGRKNFIRRVFLMLTAVTVTLTCCAAVWVWREGMAAKAGVEAVKLLYDFGTVEQLDMQMSELRHITSESVYNQLTIDNEERTLGTYLKFKNEPVTVNVITSAANYVIYSLDTLQIDPDRRFVFFYNINHRGVITWVRECELYDFVTVAD